MKIKKIKNKNIEIESDKHINLEDIQKMLGTNRIDFNGDYYLDCFVNNIDKDNSTVYDNIFQYFNVYSNNAETTKKDNNNSNPFSLKDYYIIKSVFYGLRLLSYKKINFRYIWNCMQEVHTCYTKDLYHQVQYDNLVHNYTNKSFNIYFSCKLQDICLASTFIKIMHSYSNIFVKNHKVKSNIQISSNGLTEKNFNSHASTTVKKSFDNHISYYNFQSKSNYYDIMNSDMFIMLCNGQENNFDGVKYVEMGIALGMGIPIHLISFDNMEKTIEENMYFGLSNIKRYNNPKQFLTEFFTLDNFNCLGIS